jgi:hypothetical protein
LVKLDRPAPGRPTRQAIYRQLDEAVAGLDHHLGGILTPAEAGSIWTLIRHLEVHHSTALEGPVWPSLKRRKGKV